MNKYLVKLMKLGELLIPHRFEYWQSLTDGLSTQFQQPPPPTLTIKNIARKWELVSAFQKTVRRGDAALACQLASAMAGLASERQYMWRRICTVAAEDVGAGNPDLMAFVLAASSVFTPSTLTPTHTRALWVFLTRQMCLAVKSRLYCQFSLLQESQMEYGAKIQTFHSTEFGRQLGKIVSADLKAMPHSPKDQWLVTANWRAEGMSVGPIWHEMLRAKNQDAATLTQTPWNPPPPSLLSGLPSYAYDKHTQVGKAALTRVCTLPIARKLFNEHPCSEKRDAFGWALFYEEGGRIQNELSSMPMVDLEQRLIADRLNISPESWAAIKAVVSEIVTSGQMDAVRANVLSKLGYCDNCIQLAIDPVTVDAIGIRLPAQQTFIEMSVHHG